MTGTAKVRVTAGAQTAWTVPGGSLTIGRDPESVLVVDGQYVSRHHAVIREGADGWELQDLQGSNGTWADGRRIDRLAITGPLRVWLGPPDRGAALDLIPEAADAGAPALPVGEREPSQIQCRTCGLFHPIGTQWCPCGAYLPFEAEVTAEERPLTGLTLSLGLTQLAADVGAEATCPVSINNTGTLVDRFVLTVKGPAAAWSVVEPASLSLFPGTTGTALVHLRPPRDARTPAGVSAFEVVATSESDDRVFATQNASIDVRAYIAVSARLLPPTSHGTDFTSHHLMIENAGNALVTLAVEGKALDNLVAFDFQPSVVTVPPGATASVDCVVRPFQQLMTGPPQAHPFEVLLRAGTGPDVKVEGAMVQDALPPPPPPPPPPPVPEPVAPPPPRVSPFTLRVLPLMGALVSIVGAALTWASLAAVTVSGFKVPASFLFDGTSLVGNSPMSAGLLVALFGLGGLALATIRASQAGGVRRVCGAAVVLIVVAFVAQFSRGFTNAQDLVSALRAGVYITAGGGLLLALTK